MAQRKLLDKLVSKDNITEPMVLIEGSYKDYITPSGQVYVDYGNNNFFPKKNFINTQNGYLYVNINTETGAKQRRVHILVAQAFIDNPLGLSIVGHKDNNKANCSVDNLYWTTVAENTQKAYQDGLAKNAKGYEDSQSMPVYVFDLNKQLLLDYGSISEAAKALGLAKGTIANQCKHNVKTKPRCGYYFRYQQEYDEYGFIL